MIKMGDNPPLIGMSGVHLICADLYRGVRLPSRGRPSFRAFPVCPSGLESCFPIQSGALS